MSSQTNHLASTRATLQFSQIPEFEYSVQAFTLPGLNVTLPEVATPFRRLPQTPDTLTYEDINVTFMVDSRLANWKRIHDWIRSNAFPVEYKEYKERKFGFTDGTMIIYSDKHNPIARAEFKNLFPRFLSGIDFNMTDPNTVTKTSTTALTFDYYELFLL